jgi:hypothetical protein
VPTSPRTSPAAAPQRGLAAAAVIVVLILVAVVLVLGRSFVGPATSLDQRSVTDANFRQVSDALVRYASLNQRLPCPARGDLDTGAAEPETATDTCTAPDGVVPWRTLGLGRGAALDGWGRKISYRVFTGATGFTRAGGVSMTNCNTSIGSPFDTSLASPGSQCKPATFPPNTPQQFLDARGNMLVVQEFGTVRTGNAFVLVSHGQTGRGSYAGEAGVRAALPNAAGSEYANAQATGPFMIVAQSAPSTDPDAAAHFDDVLAYKAFADLVAESKLSARAWGIPPTVSSVTFDAATVAAAGGDTANFNTGQNTLDFGTFTVTAIGDTARNVSFDRAAGGGIGSIGAGSNTEANATVNYATNEELQFVFDVPARYLGITLNRFGDTFGERERVRFRFTIGGSTVSITKVACRNDNNDGVVNYTLAPGGDFDEVFVEARSTQFGSYDSTFIVGAIATCPSTNPACKAPGAIPANDCP